MLPGLRWSHLSLDFKVPDLKRKSAGTHVPHTHTRVSQDLPDRAQLFRPFSKCLGYLLGWEGWTHSGIPTLLCLILKVLRILQ